MKRDERKPAFPGYLEATAGGAAQKGEDPMSAAYRELREETGIVADTLEPIENMVYRRMINYQYLCVTDCDKDSITLQEGETVDYKWVTEKEFVEFINSGDMIPTQRERYTEYFKKLGYIN
jgi:8-oxo-dGTP pyrophosphatase MutT (NUDIX family)